jgi:hypothetical protein
VELSSVEIEGELCGDELCGDEELYGAEICRARVMWRWRALWS